MPSRLVIANMSGFYGDRLSAAAEVVRGGPIDVLTGDYLAELTMAILHKARLKDADGGYVTTFLRQMEEVLGECLARSIRVVANAGGLNPRGLARELERIAARLGVSPRIAVVEGDDLAPRLDDLARLGEDFAHLDRGEPLGEARGRVITANAYLGAWGIKEALDREADVVITGRVTDAALVVGPCASRFGWRRDDWDRLAGAVAAGHVLECGTQATGGNYAFFEEVPSLRRVGFPIAEVHPDGSFVITKHPGTGGLVSVGTVTAQLVYEIDSPRYASPDVTARFDSLILTQEGPDRVRVAGARGEPPPPTHKAALNLLGGYRNTVTLMLAGLDIQAKARLVEEELFEALGGRDRFASANVTLIHRPEPDPASNEDAIASLRITVTSPDRERVGKRFSAAVVEMVLASVPGITGTSPPGEASLFAIYWPTRVDSRHLRHRVTVGGESFEIEGAAPLAAPIVPVRRPAELGATEPWDAADTVHVPLGRLFGARSGDKGGNANLGVWARTPEAHAFLRAFLTSARLVELLPDLRPFPIERHELPNLLAVNFVIRGLLGDGAAASTRFDPQAKTLAEYFRAKHAGVPRILLPAGGRE
jgi:hypothetical protein